MELFLMFSYGSNMNLIDLEKYCTQKSNSSYFIRKISNVELKNHSLLWNVYSKKRDCGVLNIEPKVNESVWGILYEINAEMLSILDKKEGVPKSYFRKKITVHNSEGKEFEAETYIALHNFKTSNFWPNKDYLEIVLNATIQNNLPQEYIDNLKTNVPVNYIKSKANNNFKIAIYSGSGVGGKTLKTWCDLFENNNIGSLTILYSHQFSLKNINKFDLIILPGGGGTKICNGLGDLGKENLREYLINGGKLLGVCAGAYAISAEKKEYMAVSPIGIVDIKHSNRGRATLKLKFESKGKQLFNINGEENVFPINYNNGPVIYQTEVANTSNFEILALFNEEITHENGEKEDMINTPAIWKNNFGKGMVYGISPHIESTPNLEYLIFNFINNILATDFN